MSKRNDFNNDDYLNPYTAYQQAYANSRGLAQKSATKTRSRKRKRNFILYYILLFVLILAVGIILSLTVFFKLEKIGVEGVNMYDYEQIVRASGIIKNDNMFRVDTGRASDAIMSNLIYCESVEVQKKFPSAVVIKIKEGNIAFSAFCGEFYAYLSENGRILEVGQLKKYPGSVVVKGLVSNDVKAGDFIDVCSDDPNSTENYDETDQAESDPQISNLFAAERFNAVRQIFNAIEEAELSGIKEIDVQNITDIKLRYKNRLILNLGDVEDICYKLKSMKKIIKDKIEKSENGTLYYVKSPHSMTESFHFNPD
ncbi:MAG: FtsQ-type POTRA domain-containing protein [Oscillospiraceae bacterium]|nr:FtsQ-type POTRA domain-containing protein [Oscillospiraceae bacterium]